MKCLYFLTYEALNSLVEDELNIKNWFVRNDKIKNRKESIVYSERFNTLKERAEKFNFYFDDTEVVTWLDTLNVLYFTFDRIEDDHLKNSISIIQEFCIPYSNKRADYLLVYDNKILIIEFSFNKLGYEFNYETKLQQAIGYKELLSNILPKEIDIGTYTFLIEPEEDKYGNVIKVDEHLPNDFKIDNLAQYIEKFFKKNEKSAMDSLFNIDIHWEKK